MLESLHREELVAEHQHELLDLVGRQARGNLHLLEGDAAVLLHVLGEPDAAHAAFAELLLDEVAARHPHARFERAPRAHGDARGGDGRATPTAFIEKRCLLVVTHRRDHAFR